MSHLRLLFCFICLGLPTLAFAQVRANQADLSEKGSRSLETCARQVVVKAIQLMRTKGTEAEKAFLSTATPSIAFMPFILNSDGETVELSQNDWRLRNEGENRFMDLIQFQILGIAGPRKFYGRLKLSVDMVNHQFNCHAKPFFDETPLERDLGLELFEVGTKASLLNLAPGADYLQ